MVTDLIRATPEDDVLRRDIFDRPPIFKWTQARFSVCGALYPETKDVSCALAVATFAPC